MSYKILQGDNRETLKTLADNSIDAIVTDPPYGIDFLGKAWDANTGALETYQECLRVLKPGGHILAFSAARTYHHLAVTLEQAGFEIRDQIMWIYSSGFPKSQNVGKMIDSQILTGGAHTSNQRKMAMGEDYTAAGHYTVFSADKESELAKASKETKTPAAWTPKTELGKQYQGWGTQLKPAHEPICLARKPIKTSIAKNAQKWGTGALNIDATRIPFEDEKAKEQYAKQRVANANQPANPRKTLMGSFATKAGQEVEDKYIEPTISGIGRFPSNVIGEILQADYQKYFYCPKVSRKERHIGFDTKDIPTNPDGMWDDGVQFQEKKQTVNSTKSMLETMGAYYIDKDGNPLAYEDRGDNPQIYIPGIGNIYTHGLKQEYLNWCKTNNKSVGNVGNNHPTVKPIELMKYLIKLITPPGGTVLDPFNGSGSTGMAAVELGFDYIGCELDPAYVEITEKRIEAWLKTADPIRASGLFEDEE